MAWPRPFVPSYIICILPKTAAFAAIMLALLAPSLLMLPPANASQTRIGQRVEVTMWDAKFLVPRTVVRHGDRLAFCNRDTIQHRPFSLTQGMQFEAPMIVQGQCWELMLSNRGPEPVELRINSKLLSEALIELIVLPEQLPAFPAGGKPEDCRRIGQHCLCRPAPGRPRGEVEARFCTRQHAIGLNNCWRQNNQCRCHITWRTPPGRGWPAPDEVCRDAAQPINTAGDAPRFAVATAHVPNVASNGPRGDLSFSYAGTVEFPLTAIFRPRAKPCVEPRLPQGENCATVTRQFNAGEPGPNLVMKGVVWCTGLPRGTWTFLYALELKDKTGLQSAPVDARFACAAQ